MRTATIQMVGQRYRNKNTEEVFKVEAVLNDPPSPGYITVVAHRSEKTNRQHCKSLLWFKNNMTRVYN